MGCRPQAVLAPGQAPELPGQPDRFAYVEWWSGQEADVWVFFDKADQAVRSVWITGDDSGW